MCNMTKVRFWTNYFKCAFLCLFTFILEHFSTISHVSHVAMFVGEDRWLCTLLLQQGWRVEYNAASDAYTNSPEEFKEFYNQRRRWGPSTLANTLDLLHRLVHIVSTKGASFSLN